ncbi:hypothetical protein [Serinibacter salmoneus]|uniref:LPXTG-motif cell wall-anchored protein n=1 Tax=Serinibacter salmoneus TaxID=556530 RepID=A0A2A9CZM0_9MICO|nr:hypothetical protein [Serinibacter salmoneus]PFG19898.1 hypothetical protein ATL40_1475 [Serinibacter salmoneus]
METDEDALEVPPASRHWWHGRAPWWAWIALICAVGLVPWIVYLRITLPRTYVVETWGAAWVGFDIALAALFALTAWAAAGRSHRFVMFATATGTMLFVDGWFDTMLTDNSEDRGSYLALLLEVPLGIALLMAAAGWFRELRRVSATGPHHARDPGRLRRGRSSRPGS